MYQYLTGNEIILLEQAETTVNLLHEVANLRAENAKLRKKELERALETQQMLDKQNSFIGNMLSSLINKIDEEAESKGVML